MLPSPGCACQGKRSQPQAIEIERAPRSSFNEIWNGENTFIDTYYFLLRKSFIHP
jgi:hypothetical protein